MTLHKNHTKPSNKTKSANSRAGNKSNSIFCWSRLKWALPFLAAVLPIVLLSVYTLRITSDSILSNLESENLTATQNVSQLITQDFKKNVSFLHAFATVPGTVMAMSDRDEFTMNTRLKAIVVASPEIDRIFAVGSGGMLWSSYPTSSGSYGSDLSDTVWFNSVTKSHNPFISDVYLQKYTNNPVVAISVPVFTDEADLIGMITFEYQVSRIVDWLENIELSHGGNIFVVDHTGTVVAHPDIPKWGGLQEGYGSVQEIEDAMSGIIKTARYSDPFIKQEMLGTFLPISVGSNTWVIIAQQYADRAFADYYRALFSMSAAGGVLTLVTLALVIGLARMNSKNMKLNRELSVINQKLREVASIVTSSNDAIIGLSIDGIVTSWNDAAQRIYGYSMEEAVGSSINQIVPEEEREGHQKLLPRLNHGEGVKDFETIHVRKDNKQLPILVTLSPVKDDVGNVIGASAICRDITERKKLEQMKDDFIGFVSHQLKAPIAALKWTLEMIFTGDYGDVNKNLEEPLKAMQKVVEQNSHLVGEILNASRIDRGVIKMNLKSISLKDVAERAVQNYRVPIKEKNLELKEIGWDQDIIVLVDLEKTAEAVSNAISNAIKYTESGSITVELSVDGKLGVIKVIDTGNGMDEETRSKLFTRDQVLGGNAKAEKSAGLGLYIAKRFMEQQGGDVAVESKLGEGSTFVYKIPLDNGKSFLQL